MQPVFPFFLYLIAFVGLLSTRTRLAVVVLAWTAGTWLHIWHLFPLGEWNFAFTFFNAMALTALLLNVMVLLLCVFKPAWHLGLVTLPCVLAAVWIDPVTAAEGMMLPGGLMAHILISLLAYGVVLLAGAQALMLLLKEHQLDSRHLGDAISRLLPPLDRMESQLFEITALGLILLTIGLAVGATVLSDPFIPGMIHKSVFSLLAWSTLVALLWGHWRFGWRGRFAAGMTLAALGFLVLGFLGTKLVLEVILGQPT